VTSLNHKSADSGIPVDSAKLNHALVLAAGM
jgi:hypothetical protein